MTSFTPKEKLTAYQRWEVAAFDEAERHATLVQHEAHTQTHENEQADHGESSAVALPTAADIEAMHEEAHRQGYEAGLTEAKASLQDSIDRLNTLSSNFEQALKSIDQHIADQLLATAVEIANQVMRQSLNVKPELLLPIVKEAINILHPHAGHPVLYAHPEDTALIQTHLGEQLKHNNWRIVDDDSISRGGCRVELGASEVDATLETRWRRVIEAMGLSPEWLDDKI